MNSVAWIAFCTLLRKECVRIFRIWQQTLVSPCITSILYFVIFGAFLGKHIGAISGVSYIDFLVPGLVMMNSTTNAYSNVSSAYFSAKFQNVIDELLIAPIPSQLIMWAYIFSGIVRGGLIGIIVLIVSEFFAPLHIAHVVLALIVFILSLAIFSLAGFINGLYAKKFDDVAFVPNYIILPLTYLGGVFYSIHSLPPVWQMVAKFNPIFYLIDAFRYALIGQSDVNFWLAIGFVFGLFLVFYGLAVYLLKINEGLRG